MKDILFWLYLVNSVLLINHEIESAYWHEWKLFRLPGDITGFLMVHFPLLFLVLYGLVLLYQQRMSGLVISLLLSLSGVFAFTIHMYFIKQGRPEFKLPVSIAILVATLVVSLFQGAITVYALI
jgi:hypothetical protein